MKLRSIKNRYDKLKEDYEKLQDNLREAMNLQDYIKIAEKQDKKINELKKVIIEEEEYLYSLIKPELNNEKREEIEKEFEKLKNESSSLLENYSHFFKRSRSILIKLFKEKYPDEDFKDVAERLARQNLKKKIGYDLLGIGAFIGSVIGIIYLSLKLYKKIVKKNHH